MPIYDDGPLHPRVRPLLSGLIEHMRDLSGEDRVRVLDALRSQYCEHCGCDHSRNAFRCQCWNDD